MRAAVIFSLIVSCFAHPHFNNNYPTFYDESKPQAPPTVNVFKIYAPKLFYMPGHDAKRDKTIFSAANDNMINEVVDTAMFPDNMLQNRKPNNILRDNIFPDNAFPDNMFHDDSSSFFDYADEEWEPQPSSVVSRKMAPFAPLSAPLSPLLNALTPSQHLHDADYWRSDAYDVSSENDVSRVYSHIVSQDVPVPSYHGGAFYDPLFVGTSSPHVRDAFLRRETKPKTSAQYLTSVSFGSPLMQTASISDQLAAFDKATSSDESDDEADEVRKIHDVEVERNFVKTILPDNTSVTEEVRPQHVLDDEDVEEEVTGEAKGETQEVEVNIVKTVLPDDSFVVGQAGGEDERLQDELISMIQQADGARRYAF